MNSLPSSRKSASARLAVLFATVSLCLAPALATAGGSNSGTGGQSFVTSSRAPTGGIPTANNATPDAYRALVADGSNLYQTWSGDAVKWYAFLIEPGKTYVVEAFDPYTDYPGGSINGLGVYDSDGTTTPPPETNVNCSMQSSAPGLTNFGYRCIIRAFTPDLTNLTNRLVFIKVLRFADTAFQIRVRESTVYGRWTTNGYDFHVEVQNTTAESTCVQVMLYPNSGIPYVSGAWAGPPLVFTQMTIPPFGANKFVFPKGTLVGTDSRGSLRVGACPGAVNLITGGIHVNTLGFNPTINQFLPYSTSTPNSGNGSSF